jgi:hypothetical protein
MKKDCKEENAGLLPGVRASREFTPPCVANAIPPITTNNPPVLSKRRTEWGE